MPPGARRPTTPPRGVPSVANHQPNQAEPEAIMTRTGKAALTVAILGSVVSIIDAVYGGITGQAAIWDDTSGHRWAVTATNVLLVALFALLTAVLVEQADRIDSV